MRWSFWLVVAAWCVSCAAAKADPGVQYLQDTRVQITQVRPEAMRLLCRLPGTEACGEVTGDLLTLVSNPPDKNDRRTMRVYRLPDTAHPLASSMTCLVVSPDGRWIAAGETHRLVVLDAMSRRPAHTFDVPPGVCWSGVVFNRDGSRLLIPADDGTLDIYSIPGGTRTGRWFVVGAAGTLSNLTVLSDNRTVLYTWRRDVTPGWQSEIGLLDLPTGVRTQLSSQGYSGGNPHIPFWDTTVTGDAGWAVSQSSAGEGSPLRWDLQRLKSPVSWTRQGPGVTLSTVMSSGVRGVVSAGSKVAYAVADDTVEILDGNTGGVLRLNGFDRVPATYSRATPIGFTREGRLLLLEEQAFRGQTAIPMYEANWLSIRASVWTLDLSSMGGETHLERRGEEADSVVRTPQEERDIAAARLVASKARRVAVPGEWTNPGDGSVLMRIPAGSFIFDSTDYNDVHAPHTVTIPEYYIGKADVTNAQFRRFVQATRYKPRGGWEQYAWWGDSVPVVGVAWQDAEAYCQWAGLRLPSTAEWEKAARGTDGRTFPWGNDWDPSRCIASTGQHVGLAGSAVATGSCPSGASPYGCLDMVGDAWQWCATHVDPPSYGDNLPRLSFRATRGGSWKDDDPLYFHAAYDGRVSPTDSLDDLGFRVAATRPVRN